MESSSDSIRAADGTRLHTLNWGEREHPALVLLHGGGANAHWWDHLAPHFAARFRVIALDFRGHGDSERPDDVIPDAFDLDLEAALAACKTQRAPVVIGHSMGAAVALRFAASGAALRGLVLLDPSRGASQQTRRRLRLALGFGRSFATREEAVASYRFLPESERASEALRHSIATHSVEERDDGRFHYKFDPRWFTLPSRPRPALSEIRCPVLIAYGGQSEVLAREGVEKWREELPSARFAAIDDAGHHLQIDRPAKTLRAVDEFLEALPA